MAWQHMFEAQMQLSSWQLSNTLAISLSSDNHYYFHTKEQDHSLRTHTDLQFMEFASPALWGPHTLFCWPSAAVRRCWCCQMLSPPQAAAACGGCHHLCHYQGPLRPLGACAWSSAAGLCPGAGWGGSQCFVLPSPPDEYPQSCPGPEGTLNHSAQRKLSCETPKHVC